MNEMKLVDMYEKYDISKSIINTNSLKCILRAMKNKNLAYLKGQFYYYNEEYFLYLLDLYKSLSEFFNFFYSLKSDLILMFEYLILCKSDNIKLSFNAFFCPGYNTRGGYKDYLGNTTTVKLKILAGFNEYLNNNKIKHEINCYYCDTFVENCNYNLNSNWEKELEYNKSLFAKEVLKYFDDNNLYYISNINDFKCKNDISGYIDSDIVNSVPKKVYNAFYLSNVAFYEKMKFSSKQIKERNDKLATMYIITSNFINGKQCGIYLPMENMYDREKIIATNGTCTMYLKQELIKSER